MNTLPAGKYSRCPGTCGLPWMDGFPVVMAPGDRLFCRTCDGAWVAVKVPWWRRLLKRVGH